ncbi:MAG: 3-dehydroquinate synthase [Bacteroidales bacterium]|nr:3-dehydroquinate synthase [Bacteroidales bacterium]
MKTVTISTDAKTSRILIGERLGNLKNYLPPGRAIIITDENILEYYGDVLPDLPVVVMGQGEKSKTLETLHDIFDKLLEYEADRSTFIIGIGGGIVCDVAGFAASIYMRGLRFGFVSTTLLSQVDASVGGKNGVNFRRYKNMIGSFSQPEFIICDDQMLATLDPVEFRAGFAEIVKAAAIRDASLFEYMENNFKAALEMDGPTLEKLIYESVRIKASVVEKDEKEKGERRKLNFGHTFAHAIENLTDMLHGEAVSIGMMLAARLSEKLGFLEGTAVIRIEQLLRNFALPVSLNLDPDQVINTMKKDKKREGDAIHMVLLDRIGYAFTHEIDYKQLEGLLYDLCQYR